MKREDIFLEKTDCLKSKSTLKGVLFDCFPNDKIINNSILMAYELGIVEEIASRKSLDDTFRNKFKFKLLEHYPLDATYAEEAIEFWIEAYGRKILHKTVEKNPIKNNADRNRLTSNNDYHISKRNDVANVALHTYTNNTERTKHKKSKSRTILNAIIVLCLSIVTVWMTSKYLFTDNDTLEGVNVWNNSDYNVVTDLDNYRTEVIDDAMSFIYPCGFFSTVDTDGKNYTFKTNNDEFTYYIRVETADSDAISEVMNAYAAKNSQIESNGDVSVRITNSNTDSDGWAHSIVAGSYIDDDTKGCYLLTVSNGEKVYTMDIEYNIKFVSFYNPQNYMIDCMYRGFSHSGTSYELRRYEQFQNDDMGTKKGWMMSESKR